MLTGVDEKVLEALPEGQREHVRARLVTERYHAGETLFRAGSPADRVVFVTTGRVALYSTGPTGEEQRVAIVGAGNFVADASSPGARHAHTVRAMEDATVRTVSTEAWSAGLMGVLDASPVERRVLVAVLRGDHPDESEVLAHLNDLDPVAARTAIHALVESGRVKRSPDGRLSITARRRHSTAATSVLDRLS
jgi:hypothetical protein